MSFVDILVEEVALEGLDGITLPSLWLRLEERKDFSLGLEERSKAFLWRALVNKQGLRFYTLPQPRPDIEKFNLFEHICAETGIFNEPEHLPEEIYPVGLVEVEGVWGSCSTFKTRTDVTTTVREKGGMCLSYQEAFDRWGRSLVIVASQSQRWSALTGNATKPRWLKSENQYLILERLGRSRYNGLTTAGPPQLCATTTPSNKLNKYCFHIIKQWCVQGVTIKQNFVVKSKAGKTYTTTLFHLKRFHRQVTSIVQELSDRLYEYLQQQPNKMQLVQTVYDELGIDKKTMKRIRRHLKGDLTCEVVPYRTIYPEASEEEYLSMYRSVEKELWVLRLTKDTGNEDTVMDDDQDDDCDDEEAGICAKFQFLGDTDQFTWKYGDSVLRQLYDQIHASGEAGVTLQMLAFRMGMLFFRVRAHVKLLQRANLIFPDVRDVNRQRCTYYVTQPFAKGHKKTFEMTKLQFDEKTTDQLGQQSSVRSSDQHAVTTPAETLLAGAAQTTSSSDPTSTVTLPTDTATTTTTLPSDVATTTALPADSITTRTLVGETASTSSLQAHLSDADSASTLPADIAGPGMLPAEATSTSPLPARSPRPGSKAAKCNEVTVEAQLSDIKATFITEEKQLEIGKVTVKKMKRANALLDLVMAQRVIDGYYNAGQGILRLLKEAGEEVDDQMLCHKTVARLVNWCRNEGKLQKFTIKVESSNKTHILIVICANDVSPDDPSVASVIKQHKMRHFHSIFPKAPKKPPVQTSPEKVVMPPSMYESLSHWDNVIKPLPADNAPHQIKSSERCVYALPKLKRCALLHKVLWYLIYGYQGTVPPDSASGKCSPNADDAGQSGLAAGEKKPPVYLDVKDWRRYLAPLNPHPDVLPLVGRTEGTCMVGDLFPVMPICVFAQCLARRKEVVGLDKYMEDPDKSLYPVTWLPLPVLHQLLDRRSYVYRLKEDMCHLSMMGLLTHGPRLFMDLAQLFIYLHKHSKLLDTRTSLPRYQCTQLPDGQDSFPSLTFTFSSLEDVDSYWSMFQIISLSTSLHHNYPDSNDEHKTEVEISLLESTANQHLSTVRDEFVIPGDQRGAAGMDSSFYVHLSRNWRINTNEDAATVQARKEKRRQKRNALSAEAAGSQAKRARGAGASTSKSLKEGPSNPVRQKKKPAACTPELGKADAGSSRAGTLSELHAKIVPGYTGNRGGKGMKHYQFNSTMYKNTLRLMQKKKKKPRKQVVRPKKKIKTTQYDDQDREALKRMVGERVTWTPQEVNVLLMCRVACYILMPEYTVIPLPRPVIRDILHQRLPELSSDKTQQATWRMLIYCLRKERAMASVKQYVARATQDQELMSKYQQDVRPRGTGKQVPESFVQRFSQLVGDLLDKYSMIEHWSKNIQMPATIEELTQDFDLQSINAKPKSWQDPSNDLDICKSAIRDFQMSHILCEGGKQNRMYEMFSTLRQYPDHCLRAAFDRLLSDKIIVKKKKAYDSLEHLQNPALMVNYMPSQRYRMALQQKIQGLFPLCHRAFDDISKHQAQGRGKGQGEAVEGKGRPGVCEEAREYFRLPAKIEAGHVAMIIGMGAMNKMVLQVELPPNIFKLPEEMLVTEEGDGGGPASAHPDSDEEAEEAASDAQGGSVDFPPVTDAVGSLAAKRSYRGRGARPGLVSSRGRPVKRVRELSDDSSDDEQQGEDYPPAKCPRVDESERGTGNVETKSSSLQDLLQRAAQAPAVSQEDNGFQRMRLDTTCVRFQRDTEALEIQNTLLPSHTIISLSRLGHSALPVQHKYQARYHDQLLLKLCGMSVALRQKVTPTSQSREKDAAGCESSTASQTSTEQSSEKGGAVGESSCKSQTALDTLLEDSVMEGVLQSCSRLLPHDLDMEAVWAELADKLEPHVLIQCKELYEWIEGGRSLGRTWDDLKTAVADGATLSWCLHCLLETDAVLRVGVTQFRYVTLARARFWVTHTLKNNRGRGQAHAHSFQDDVVNVEDVSETDSRHSLSASGVRSVTSTLSSGAAASPAKKTKGDNKGQESDSEATASLPCVEAADGLHAVEREGGERAGQEEAPREGGGGGITPAPRRRERPQREAARKAEHKDSADAGIQPSSTYEKVRLVSRMWCKPEGGMNRTVLGEYLDRVLMCLMWNPGCSVPFLVQCFHPVFSPVAMMELLEILETLGCVRTVAMPTRTPATLFSKRARHQDINNAEVSIPGMSGKFYEATMDCALRLGQFLNYMGFTGKPAAGT